MSSSTTAGGEILRKPVPPPIRLQGYRNLLPVLIIFPKQQLAILTVLCSGRRRPWSWRRPSSVLKTVPLPGYKPGYRSGKPGRKSPDSTEQCTGEQPVAAILSQRTESATENYCRVRDASSYGPGEGENVNKSSRLRV